MENNNANNKIHLVSIIIPTYNASKFIKEAVDSALAQTYKDIEIIIIDDGSIDDTKKVLEGYLPKIKYFYQSNKGLSAARNVGIKIAKGDCIALLDADDIFLPNKIEEQIKFLEENPDCDVCYCDLYHFWDEESEKLLKLNYKYYSGDDVLPGLLEKSFIAPLTVVIRKSVFDRFGYFDENLKRSEDLDFWFRLAYGGAKICFLLKILAKLRMLKKGNLQGIESQPAVKLTGLEVVQRLNDKMPPEDRQKYRMDFYLKKYRLKVGLAYLMVGNKAEAKNYMPFWMWIFVFFIPAVLLKKLLIKAYFRARNTVLSTHILWNS